MFFISVDIWLKILNQRESHCKAECLEEIVITTINWVVVLIFFWHISLWNLS